MGRSYDQYCPVAHALDLVGERWALLVVRELQGGPLRYSDLLDRLEGCSTNVLAARLRALEEGGVVRREKLPPPAASTVYALTPDGDALRPVLVALAHWGARTLGPPPDDSVLRPGWLVRALGTAAGALPSGVRLGVSASGDEATIDEHGVRQGIEPGCDALLTGDGTAVYHLLVDHDPAGLAVEGDESAVAALLEVLVSARRAPGAAAA